MEIHDHHVAPSSHFAEIHLSFFLHTHTHGNSRSPRCPVFAFRQNSSQPLSLIHIHIHIEIHDHAASSWHSAGIHHGSFLQYIYFAPSSHPLKFTSAPSFIHIEHVIHNTHIYRYTLIYESNLFTPWNIHIYSSRPRTHEHAYANTTYTRAFIFIESCKIHN